MIAPVVPEVAARPPGVAVVAPDIEVMPSGVARIGVPPRVNNVDAAFCPANVAALMACALPRLVTVVKPEAAVEVERESSPARVAAICCCCCVVAGFVTAAPNPFSKPAVSAATACCCARLAAKP